MSSVFLIENLPPVVISNILRLARPYQVIKLLSVWKNLRESPSIISHFRQHVLNDQNILDTYKSYVDVLANKMATGSYWLYLLLNLPLWDNEIPKFLCDIFQLGCVGGVWASFAVKISSLIAHTDANDNYLRPLLYKDIPPEMFKNIINRDILTAASYNQLFVHLVRWKNPDPLRLLVKYSKIEASYYTIKLSTYRNKPGALKHLIKKPTFFLWDDSSFRDLLMHAVFKGRHKCVKILINYAISTAHKESWLCFSNYLPMRMAARRYMRNGAWKHYSDWKICKLLINAGAYGGSDLNYNGLYIEFDVLCRRNERKQHMPFIQLSDRRRTNVFVNDFRHFKFPIDDTWPEKRKKYCMVGHLK